MWWCGHWLLAMLLLLDVCGSKSNKSIWRVCVELCIDAVVEPSHLRVPGTLLCTTFCWYTHLTALCLGLLGCAGTRKVKPIWIFLKQETVSGSGISWAICKSASRSRQITMPAPHHSVFLQARCPSCHPTNSFEALKAVCECVRTFCWGRIIVLLVMAVICNTLNCVHQISLKESECMSWERALCGLQDVMQPWLDFWFRHCVCCLLVYIIGFPIYPFFFTFSLLISSLTCLFLWE